MADEAGGSAFNIHPMEQFEVVPLFGGEEVHWYTLTNATPAPPFGGATFHDAAVWVRRAD